jgi:adenylate cyclase
MLLTFAWRLGVGENQTPEEFERETERIYADALELAQRAGDLAQQAVFIGVYGAHRPRGPMARDRLETDLNLALEAVELVERVRQPALEIGVRTTATYALWLLGRYRDAFSVADQGIALAGDDPTLGAGLGVTSPYAFLHAWRASAQTYSGRLREGIAGLEEALRVAREQGDFEVECYTHSVATQAVELAGEDPGVALGHATRCVEIAERKGGAFMRGIARLTMGAAHVMNGDWAAAQASLDHAIATFHRRCVALEFEPMALRYMALAQLGAGDPRAARATAREAVTLALQRHTKGWELMSRVALARSMRACDGPSAIPAIDRELRLALILADATGARTLEPHVRLELAALHRLCGDDSGWASERKAAAALFAEVGASRLSDSMRAAA